LADNTVGNEPGSFLERFDRCFQLRAKYAIDFDLKVGSPAKCSLQTPDDITRGTTADCRLTWIGHHCLH
jgi:hypothetical protein